MRIDFGLQYADVGEVTVFLIVVQPVADHKFIGHFKAQIVGLDVGHAARGLVQQGADLEAVYALLPSRPRIFSSSLDTTLTTPLDTVAAP